MRAPGRTRGAVDLPRLLIGATMVAILFLVMQWLQGRYDASDHRKAVELVQGYRARPGAPSLPELIAQRHPGRSAQELRYGSEIKSGCLGDVRVEAELPAKGDMPAAVYRFDVRLSDPSLHPTDPVTVELMRALSRTSSTSSAARPAP